MKPARFRALMPACALILLLLQLASAVQAQDAPNSSHRTLQELATRANAIVLGRVVSTRVEPHPEFSHIQTVVVTLRVSDSLKGQVGQTYTFRQYLWDVRGRATAGGYSRGQQLLLFMNSENRHGLTSPTGMEQGRFVIVQNASGDQLAVNGRNNAGLLTGLRTNSAVQAKALTAATRTALATQSEGPITLGTLKELVTAIVGAQK